MKSIEITGKRNLDKINKVEKPKRKQTEKWSLDNIYFTHNKQVEMINNLYLNQTFEYDTLLKREIDKKIKGYKNQDIQKTLLNINKFISLDSTIEKLVSSKLKCYYCNDSCELLYRNVLSKKQWTLDRINNDLGHNDDNVVICCYECNVKRGDMDSQRFKDGKSIKIIKKHL